MLVLLILFFASDVADLGHADFRRREAATRRLTRAGVWALPAIRTARTADPEARMRLELVERRLWSRWVNSSLILHAARDLTRPAYTWEGEAAFWADAGRYATLKRVAVAMGLSEEGEYWAGEWSPEQELTTENVMGAMNIIRARANRYTLPDGADPNPGPWPKRMPAAVPR